MIVFPVLFLRLDQIRIGEFMCTKVFPAFKSLDFLSNDNHVSASYINSEKNLTEKDVMAEALKSWDPETTDKISKPMQACL